MNHGLLGLLEEPLWPLTWFFQCAGWCSDGNCLFETSAGFSYVVCLYSNWDLRFSPTSAKPAEKHWAYLTGDDIWIKKKSFANRLVNFIFFHARACRSYAKWDYENNPLKDLDFVFLFTFNSDSILSFVVKCTCSESFKVNPHHWFCQCMVK